LVIPGRIDTRMRYYDWVENISPEINEKYQIIMLGFPRDEKTDILIKLAKYGIQDKYAISGKFIPDEEFVSAMTLADLYLLPAKRIIPEEGEITIREYGPLSDAVHYGKPILVPDHLQVDEIKINNCIFYKNDAHLAGLLHRYFDDSEYRSAIHKRIEMSKKLCLNRNEVYIQKLENI